MRVKGDVAAERAVLSGIAQFGSQAMIDIADILEATSFTLDTNQFVFRCLEECLQTSDVIDLPSLHSAAKSLGFENALSSKTETEFVRALFQTPIRLENVRPLAAKLRKLEKAREIQDKLTQAHEDIGKITGNETFDSILGMAETPLFDLAIEMTQDSNERPVLMFEDAEEYVDEKCDNPVEQVGISTDFSCYDEAIGDGLRRCTVHLIVARPKTGKTSWAKQISLNIAKRNVPVLMLDTEMKKDDQLNRSLAGEANVDIRDIETGRFGNIPAAKTAIYQVVRKLKKVPYYYKNVAGKPFEEILSIIRRWLVQEVGRDPNGRVNDCVVVYDYFKLMDPGVLEDMAEYQAMGFQISKMTDFANRYDIPCLAFVQANREGIVKDTTDIVSQSDRLLWACASLCQLRRKTAEEIAEDPTAGNMIVKPLECRFGSLDDGDHINYFFDKRRSRISELFTLSQQEQMKRQTCSDMVGDAENTETQSDNTFEQTQTGEGAPF